MYSPFRMICFGSIGQSLSQSEAEVAQLGLTILMCSVIWQLLRWINSGPMSPDPWNEEVAADMERADCLQVCHRCLKPQDPPLHFCSNCGAMMGIHTCLIPPLYLYSIGDVFRAGVDGAYRPSSLLTVGYFIIAISYAYWVPFPLGLVILFIYWSKLLIHIPRNKIIVNDGT